MEPADMLIPREAWPWIIVFLVVLAAMALVGWWGYEHWNEHWQDDASSFRSRAVTLITEAYRA